MGAPSSWRMRGEGALLRELWVALHVFCVCLGLTGQVPTCILPSRRHLHLSILLPYSRGRADAARIGTGLPGAPAFPHFPVPASLHRCCGMGSPRWR